MVRWTNLQDTLGLVSGRLATRLVGSLLGPAAALQPTVVGRTTLIRIRHTLTTPALA